MLTGCSYRSASAVRPCLRLWLSMCVCTCVCLIFLLLFVQGRIDPKKHLEMHVDQLMTSNITQTLGLMLDTVLF